jgi:hypothetical protein
MEGLAVEEIENYLEKEDGCAERKLSPATGHAALTVGLNRLADRGPDGAHKHFEACVATRVFWYLEHEWCRSFLARMDRDQLAALNRYGREADALEKCVAVRAPP